jgi:hypothetical protein
LNGSHLFVRRCATRVVVCLSLVVVFGSTVVPSGVAHATPTCYGNRDETSDNWTPTNDEPYGIEAAITITTDAALCDAADGSEGAQNSIWVGIDNNAGTAISQIGFSGYYDRALDAVTYCRFYAINGGANQYYGSCAVTNDYERSFKVHVVTNDSELVYGLVDCSTGFTGCVTENMDELKYSAAYAYAASEVTYGTNCLTDELGSPGDHVNFGDTSSGDTIKFQTSQQGAWTTEPSLFGVTASCAHYASVFPSDTHMGTWDGRN